MKLEVAPGTFLLSVPQMADPNFMHTVVCMCSHDEGGAFGFVVNRKLSVTLDTLVPDHPVLSQVAFPVYSGGPVGEEMMQFLHRVPDAIAGGFELTDGLHVGGDLEAMAEYVTTSGEAAGAHARVILGYSGWGEGQLESELAAGAWIPAPLQADLVFSPDDTESLWREALRGLGELGEGLSQVPPDISWN